MYTYNDAFPGWICDTCQTWNKLMPWLYSCLQIKYFSFTPYMPIGDMDKWIKKAVKIFHFQQLTDHCVKPFHPLLQILKKTFIKKSQIWKNGFGSAQVLS